MHTIPDIAPSPHFATAGAFLEALAAHDFKALESTMEPGASMAALVPSGFKECEGAESVSAMFEFWFGDVDVFEVADASVGNVGSLLQLRWRLRLKGNRTEHRPMVVEQHAYAATGDTGRILSLRLLCSGFWLDGVGV